MQLAYADIISHCSRAVHKQQAFRMRRIDTLRYDDVRYDRFCITRTRFLPRRPSIVIAAGFHGEEPAGPMAVARGIEHWLAFATTHALNLTILPCVNPWGYDRHVRATPKTRYTNSGFAGRAKISPEFLPIKQLLSKLHIDYFVSLHEDDANVVGVFAHAFGDIDAARRVVASMASARIPVDAYPSSDDAGMERHLIGDGLVFDHHDGSAEDMVSRKPENILSLATEISSTAFPLRLRVLAHLRGVRTLLEIAAKRAA